MTVWGGLLAWARLPWGSIDARLQRAMTLRRSGRAADAVAIWTRLARDGVPRAQTNLGACLANGTGVTKDPAAAEHWLRLGAEAGDALGQRNLGSLLLPRDPGSAAHWFRRAAESGDAISQDQLSQMLLSGIGLQADPAEARRWTAAAAAQGLTAAAARLGTMWHEATGGPRDPAQAVHWWRIAAENGDADAASRLGAALHMGQGVEPDQVAAMAWLLVASNRRSTLVRPFFNRVRDGLDTRQLGLAHDAARQLGWKPDADSAGADGQD